MNIYITGIGGFLGSHLADALLRGGHKVSGCDSLIGGSVDNVPKGVGFNILDCGELRSMQSLLKGVDIVYHTACTAYEGLSVFSPNQICQNTFQNTAATLTAAISNGVKRFVYTSSMARYGTQRTPFTEDMNPKPQDPYAIAKVASEMLIKNLCETHGIEYVIAVPHNIIGPRQKYDDPFRNVAAIMINRMLQGKQPIIYGDGSHKRCFSYVGDCVDCLLKMGLWRDMNGRIFNIGPDEEFVTINELAKIIAEILDFDLKPIYVPERPKEVALSTCSADKARLVLEYKTSTTLREGLEKMVDFIKEKGAKEFTYHLPLEILNKRTPETWTKKLF
ncbi:MAG: NAD-dependent epimerase/dehydratase family protein [Planctomycetota bacterium]|jgi:UDP-glucose 4-epimerase